MCPRLGNAISILQYYIAIPEVLVPVLSTYISIPTRVVHVYTCPRVHTQGVHVDGWYVYIEYTCTYSSARVHGQQFLNIQYLGNSIPVACYCNTGIMHAIEYSSRARGNNNIKNKILLPLAYRYRSSVHVLQYVTHSSYRYVQYLLINTIAIWSLWSIQSIPDGIA